MTSMRMPLVSSVFLLRYFSNAAGCSVKPLLLLLAAFTFETSTMQKPRILKLSKQKLRNEPQ